MKSWRIVLITIAGIFVFLSLHFWFRPVGFYDNLAYLDELLHGFSHRWTWVDGHRVHYETIGPSNGKPVVLIHGLGGRAENWTGLAPYLARAGYRVYMPDLLGYGRSDKPPNFSYSIRDAAAFVIHFLDAVRLDRVDLGGWSMGGWIVQVAAFNHPERIHRLMLFDSAGIYAAPDWDTRLFAPTNIPQLKRLEDRLMPNPPAIPRFVAKDILRSFDNTGWVISRAMDQMLTGRDVTDALLPHLHMPVLIAWGALDRITPEDQAEKIHHLLPNSQLQVYAGCGHLAPLQCAGAIGPNVVQFLQNSAPM